MAVILFIFLRLWTVTYAETHQTTLAGLSLAQMLWYLTLTECIILSTPRIAQTVDEDVRTGSLAIQLVRPVSYPLYRLAVTLGERSIRFALNIIVGAIVAFLLVGPINFQVNGLLFCLITLPFAFIVDFLGNFLVGLFAFWLEDTSGLLLIYSKLIMVLGGMLMPVELFPEPIKSIVQVLPFSALVYGPAKIFVDPSIDLLTDVLLHQLFGGILFGMAVWLLYNKAVKRVQGQGG